MAKLLKKIIHRFGNVLGFLGFIFVALKIAEHCNHTQFLKLSFFSWLLLTILAIFYGALGILLSLSWRELLRHFGVTTKAQWAIHVYGVSQLAKYLPGNMFHFAGRYVMGITSSLPSWPLLQTVLWELGTMSVTASLFVFLILPLVDQKIQITFALSIFFLLLIILLWMAQLVFDVYIAHAVGIYTIFMLLSGMIFTGTLAILITADFTINKSALSICGAYVIAWLAGLLTPGAPAGIGVREFVLYGLLNSLISEADLAMTIMLHRVITIAGDLLFYLLASAFF